MGLLNLFKLEKMKILSFDKEERSGMGKKFEVMFNPETYSLRYENKFSALQGINSSGRPSKYALSSPTDLAVTLIIDGTGASDIGANKIIRDIAGKNDIKKIVEDFLEKTTIMDGDIHEPRYLRLEWGDLEFSCRLKSVDIKYTLFDKAGAALRAELACAFFGQLDPKKQAKLEGKQSPDLTHVVTVVNGDTLPLLTEKVYGSPQYYVQVAKYNNLNKFRDLKPGQQITFPPLV